MKESDGLAKRAPPRNLAKYQGILLKKRKFMGFKECYVVLSKGHLIYYSNEVDANNDQNRKATYSLNNAYIEEYTNSSSQNYLSYSWTVNFPDRRQHTLCALTTLKKIGGLKTPVNNPNTSNVGSKINPTRPQLNPADRKKKWLSAFKEHIEYSEANPDPVNIVNNLSVVPTERIEQQLKIIKMDQERLQSTVAQIEAQLNCISTVDLNELPINSNLYQTYRPNFDILKLQIQVFIDDTNKYLNLQDQKDLIIQSQLSDSKAKCQLLEHSLRSIVQENTEMNESKNIEEKNESPTLSVENSSANSIESDSSEYDEYFDTAEEHESWKKKLEKNQSLKVKGSNQTTSFANDVKRPIKSANDRMQDDKEINRDSGISAEAGGTEVAKSSNTISILETNEHGWRIKLPAKMIDQSQISLWTIAKHFIGKDLTKISMPVFLCEPLSFLQRIGENGQYSELITRATASPDPCKRMEYMAAHALSICSSIERTTKPFNPLLGETYEIIRADLGFRGVYEQVSHHPPISAFFVDSTDPNKYWRSYGSVNPRIKFWGKSVEVIPNGLVTTEIVDRNETYSFRPATCIMHNIIVGTPWFEYTGTLEVTCHQTGYKAVLNFRPYSRSNKELHRVDGYIYDKKMNKLKAMYGYWTHCLYSCDAESFENYLKTNKTLPVAKYDKYFNIIEPLIPYNTHNSSANLRLNQSETPANRLSAQSQQSTQSAPRFTLNESDEMDSWEEDNETNFVDENNNRKSLPVITNSSNGLLSVQNKGLSSSVSSLSTLIKDLAEVWIVNPQPPYSAENYYNFSYYAMSLNEIKNDMEGVIAPTDSRYRSDIRQLELGDLDGASKEKTRLEVKQREARKNQTDEYKAKWFTLAPHPFIKQDEWMFTNKYWLRDYSDCPNLY